VREGRPGRRQLGAEGDDEQHRQALEPVDDEVEQLEGGGIDPVQVLDHRQDRPLPGQALELVDQDPKGPRLPLLRREVRGRVPNRPVQAKERRQERGRLPRVGHGAGEERLQVIEASLGRVVALEAGGPLELPDHRPKGAVAVVGGGLVAQGGTPVAAGGLAQRLDQARLADPGLAREEHDLALPGPGLPPAAEEQLQLLLAPDERRRRAAVPRLEAALGPAFGDDAEGRDRCREALERLRPERLELEELAHQPAGGGGDHHLVGPGEGLEPGGEVGGLADHGLFPRRALAQEVAHDDQAGRDPDSGRGRLAPRGVLPADAVDDGERGPDRALRVVLVRPRPAEVGEDAVAHELGYMPVVAGDCAGDRVLVGAEHLAQLLGIEPRG
jgi:hypothetical protein